MYYASLPTLIILSIYVRIGIIHQKAYTLIGVRSTGVTIAAWIKQLGVN